MILGMTTATYTLLHVLISLVGIGTGLVVMYGLLTSKRLDRWTVVFLVTTAATSLTGFAFPFKGVTPGIVIGVLSMIALAIAAAARYRLRMNGSARWFYVVTASIALYFNVFVLIVQSFEKVPALHALAPTQKEAPFQGCPVDRSCHLYRADHDGRKTVSRWSRGRWSAHSCPRTTKRETRRMRIYLHLNRA